MVKRIGRPRTALGIGAALVLVGTLAVVGVNASSIADAASSAVASTSASPSASAGAGTTTGTASSSAPVGASSTTTTTAPTVVAIGDSIMDGHGTDADQAWPILVAADNGWSITNLSSDGTGFLQPGDDGTTFEAQVQRAAGLDPDIVIISASTNDLDQDADALATATMDTMTSLRAALPNTQIIALSAFWGDTAPSDELDPINGAMQSAAQAVDARWVDIGQPLADRPDLMQSDDVHPTAEGLSVLAAAIEADLDPTAQSGSAATDVAGAAPAS
ncbi:SGNH/GDSL hydrolase family protein [Plantibacter sp. YIM 135347]|uniref:SGNH/GDSL hydrolase family protein n=1 Tax=Plantibacter sp. YIM 135347 TaxID=3423919 RepID=UPI003D3528A9